MAPSTPASALAEPDASVGRATTRRRRRLRVPALTALGLAFVVMLGLVAVLAPWIAPQDPTRQSLRGRLSAPSLEGADGKSHIFGTDHLGRDVLSRVMWGSRVSLTVGFAAVLVGGIIGSVLGILAGFRGGWTDSIVMTVADAQLAFPFILLAIGIIAVLGPSFPTLVVVIGLSGWVAYARVLRSQVLSLRSREFVDAIRALGGSFPRIVLQHVLPNVLSSLVVIATLELARAIVLEATLSFLGLGIQPPEPSWGTMLGTGRKYMELAPWVAIFPGAAVMLLVLGFNVLGDGLRDVLDPRLQP